MNKPDKSKPEFALLREGIIFTDEDKKQIREFVKKKKKSKYDKPKWMRR